MELKFTENKINEQVTGITAEAFVCGERATGAYFTVRPSRYHSEWIPALTVGGVATDPEYRREGHVRKILESAFENNAQYGAYVSLLHPFSFSYYRKFGYEKVADHLILEFPIEGLGFLPRVNDFVKLRGEERVGDVLKIFEKFSEGRNLMFRRFGSEHLPLEPDLGKRATYIRCRDGEPVAYVTLSCEKVFYVNQMRSVNLNVWELAFTDPEALRDIFGFLRMFEGENDTVKIHNCAMIPEVDIMLREYIRISYTIIPDIMARVLDTEKMLSANAFPHESGAFRIAVDDVLPDVRGVFEVEYGQGRGKVTRLAASPDAFSGKTDIECNAQALSQILYGYHSLTPQLLPYIDGVRVTGNPTGLILAYPKAVNGIFEHF